MVEGKNIVAPFLRRGTDTGGMMLAVLACLTVSAAHFSVRYDPSFIARYVAYLLYAGLLEVVYRVLKDGRVAWPHASTLVTAALLVLSVPARMPWLEVGAGIFVAVWFAKFTVDRTALRLNPMLVGRLFMMLFFADSIQVWLRPGVKVDALTSATPLGLWGAEEQIYSPLRVWLGDIGGNWHGVYAIVPGAPGEVMPLLALVCGVILYLVGVVDWRPGVMFLAGFALTCAAVGLPVGFELAAGSVVFTAVYIITDPRSTPGSRFGRFAAGFLAGIFNALLRKQGFYPEGIVFAVLAVNLLSPTLDRLAFHLRGRRLAETAKITAS